MEREVQNKIVMVNSFKGGTGKTSVALSYCVYNWNQGDYKNIYFVDVDRLGTSMSYALFPGEKQPCYFEEYSKKGFDGVCNEIELSEDSTDKNLYAVLLNPVANRRQDYDVHGRMRQHESISQGVFEKNLLEFIDKCLDCAESSLFVVDCSPGLSEMEQHLLNQFYNRVHKLEVEEIYVTTFDSSQIKKTVECLNDHTSVLHRDKRNISIVLNDLHNCQKIAGEIDGFLFDWKSIAKEMLENLKDIEAVKIRFKKFESKQLTASIIKNERHLINNTDAYVLDHEYREEYISRDRMDG